MTDPSKLQPSTSKFADDLARAGFYAVSNDVRARRLTVAQALEHVRTRTTAHRNVRGRAMAQDVLDRWERP